MLPLQFFGQNIHFAISLFAALVFFAVFWLYFDAWNVEKGHKNGRHILGWLGFMLASLGFLVQATIIEQSILGKSLLGDTSNTVATILRLAGYLLIIAGQLVDPLQKRPDTKGMAEMLTGSPAKPMLSDPPKRLSMPVIVAGKAFGLVFALPVAALAIVVLYWRRATKGLERHLKPVALAFLLFGIFELISLTGLWQNTANPNVYNLVKAFGPLWSLGQLFLLAGSLVLGRWVWKYLIKRFISQLFMLFTTGTLVIFMITTISFTFLLMRNIQNAALDNLQTAANVLDYAIDSKKAETLANAQIIAQNSQIAAAITAKDHNALVSLTSGFLGSKKQSALDLTSATGQVLLRAEDPTRWGDSSSSNSLIRRALVGDSVSSVSTQSGVLAPVVNITSSVPVRDDTQNVVGTATVSVAIDSALVDGIKSSTGLDSAVYSGNTLSATTFVGPDGHSRQIGVKETDENVTNKVLVSGQTFKGQLDVLNRPFLAVYSPLKDADNNVVGMLFVGQPQTGILQAAGRSIQLTFVVAVILILLTIIPAYLMARQLSRQLE